MADFSTTDLSSSSSTAQRKSNRSLWIAVVAVVLLVGAYFAVKAIFRAMSDSAIEGNVDKPLPTFALKDRSGATFHSADFKGRRMVLHFFRSHCPSCDEEAPAIREFEASLDPRRTTLVGILVDQLQGFDQQDSDATLKRMKFEHPILIADESIAEAFHGLGWTHVTPITYIVNSDGVVVKSLRGAHSFEELSAALQATS